MLRRPNALPLQAQQTRRQTTRMRRRKPKQSTRTQYPREFLYQRARFEKVLQKLSGRDDVEMRVGKLRRLKFTGKDFKTQFADVFRRVRRDINSADLPSVLAPGLQRISPAPTRTGASMW